jgi:hypothetical protein
MSKKEYRRINLWVDLDFYNEIKKKAEASYLRIGTYARQIIQQAVKNNTINNECHD